jgi:hypothetical protein
MKQDESPPMIAIYLLLAFLTLQYASSLFRTNEVVYDGFKKQLKEIQEALREKENPPPPVVVEEKKPKQEAPKTPPLIVRKNRNKVSQTAEPLRANPAYRQEKVRDKNDE